MYSDKKDILTSHKAKLQLKFNHNHPINSAHVLSFCLVNEKTKEKYYKLFQSGHSAASATHYYENTLMDTCDEEELQGTMCDRSINPILQDVSRLYSQWRLSEYGSDRNGKVLSESLIEEISLYNITNAASGGKACVQVYDTGNTKGVASTFEVVRPGSRSGLLWVCQGVGVVSFCCGYMFILFLDTVLRCCPTKDHI